MNANTTPTVEQSLALADYHMLTALSRSVEATLRVQERVANARVADIAYHAAELVRQAQESETLLKAAGISGVESRHPEAYARAAEGDSAETYLLMVAAISPVMGE